MSVDLSKKSWWKYIGVRSNSFSLNEKSEEGEEEEEDEKKNWINQNLIKKEKIFTD